MSRPGTPQRTIGELSQQTGCKVETIRYYEKVGLMPEPPRTVGGHRIYGGIHVQRLSSIRRCRSLGFTIEEVRELLGLVDAGSYTCVEAQDIVLRHLEAVRTKLKELQTLETVLEGMVAECSGGSTPDCPFLDALFTSPDPSSGREA